MEYLPYDILCSVAILLSDKSASVVVSLSTANPQFGAWTDAVKKETAKRQNCGVYFSHSKNGWKYDIWSGNQGFTVDEFKGMNKERTRLSYVRMDCSNQGAYKSSEEEILEIAAITAPFVNMATLYFNNDRDEKDSLRAIPKFYRDCSFSEITFLNYQRTTFEDFLVPQLQSARQGALHAAAEEFARDESKIFY